MGMNDAQIKALRCEDGPFSEHSVDPTYPGLRIRVTSGEPPVKTWYLVYRVRGERKQNRLKLGRYYPGGMTLAAARVEARKHLTIADRREDPRAIIAAGMKSETTVGDLMELMYADRHEFQKRAQHTQNTYRQIFTDYLGGVAKLSVTDTEAIRAGVRIAFQKAADEGKEPTANKVLQFSKRLFRWALAQEHIKESQFPHALVAIKKPYADVVRQRVYSHDEIRAIVKAQQAEVSPILRSYWRLLWLTAARENNVRKMRWEAIEPAPTEDGGPEITGWFLSPLEMKARRPEVIPMTSHALAVLDEMRPWTGAHKYVHPKVGNGGRQWTDETVPEAGERLHQREDSPIPRMGAAVARICERSGVDFHPHALRHTIMTNMGVLKVPEAIASRVLSHMPAGIPGVTSTYNHFAYLREKHDALSKWGDYLGRILAGK
jgi:integrase